MTDKNKDELCDVCYLPILHKVSLECNHVFCLKCVIKILEKGQIKCPMCRKIFPIIDDKDEKVLYVQPYPYEININRVNDIEFKDIVCTENKEYYFYDVHINNVDSYIIPFIIETEVANDFIEELIYQLVLSALPYTSIQDLRQTVSLGHYKLVNTNHYIQNYYDIVISRVETQ